MSAQEGYTHALMELRQQVNRELNLVQVGAPPADALLSALSTTVDARGAYVHEQRSQG